MNIENLKNMPIIGEDPVSAMTQIASAILAAGQEARDFVQSEEGEMEAAASKMYEERAKTHEDNAANVSQSEEALATKYAAVKEEYSLTMQKLISFITSNADESDVDSISEALGQLQAADDEMDVSFLNFNDQQTREQNEIESEYGNADQVTAILLGGRLNVLNAEKQLQGS